MQLGVRTRRALAHLFFCGWGEAGGCETPLLGGNPDHTAGFNSPVGHLSATGRSPKTTEITSPADLAFQRYSGA